MNGFVKACAVTALVTQGGSMGGAQEATAPTLPETKTSAMEKILNPGPFHIRPYGSLAAYYDSNFLLENTDEMDDLIWTITPGVTIGAGDSVERVESFLSLDYSANVYVFTENTDFTGHNQNVNFSTRWKGSKLTLSLAQLYQGSFGGLISATNRMDREFAGTNVNQQIFPTLVEAHYQLSDKTSIEVDGMQLVRDVEGSLTSYNQWTVNPWFNYQATEKLQTSLGANLGWYDVRGGTNISYQQALVRLSYQVTTKVNAVAAVGCQWDQFQGGLEDGPFVVFSAGLNYQPREGTKLALEAHRRQYPSITEDQQTYLLTGFSTTLRQRIWNRLSASVIGGYDYTDYDSTVAGGSSDLTEDYFYVGPSLEYSITPRWDVSVFYVYRENNANQSSYDYDNHQAGVYTAYRF